MGQGSSQLLIHTWIMNMTQKPWYITGKRIKRKGRKKKKKQKEEGRLKKHNCKKKERTLNY